MNRVEMFEENRNRLRAIAYRMLGTPDDADDAIQETWLRFSNANVDEIHNVAGWLTTACTRLCIDHLKSAQHRRESYVGPWLPDPVPGESVDDVGPVDHVLLAESLSIGFLAVLERVSPLERAVFLLHEVFAYPLTEVAEIVERSPSATRQLAKRARDHVQADRVRFAPDPAEIEQLTQLLLAAALEGDVETLKSYLADDVVHISDGGAKYRAARVPIVGAKLVSRFFLGITKRWDPAMTLHETSANGQYALYITIAGEPSMLLVTNWVEGKVTGAFGVRNPDKLASFHRAWTKGQQG